MFNLVKHWKLIILVINVIIFSLSIVVAAEPLNDAAKGGDLDEARRLIEGGADIECRDASSSTPIYNAVDGGHRDLAEFLISKGANINVNCENGNTLCTVLQSYSGVTRKWQNFSLRMELM